MQTKGRFLWPETIDFFFFFLTAKSKNISVMYNNETGWPVFDLLVIWYQALSQKNRYVFRLPSVTLDLFCLIQSSMEDCCAEPVFRNNRTVLAFARIMFLRLREEPKRADAQRLKWRVFHKASLATGLKIKPGKVVLIPYWSHSLISHLAFAFPSA